MHIKVTWFPFNFLFCNFLVASYVVYFMVNIFSFTFTALFVLTMEVKLSHKSV